MCPPACIPIAGGPERRPAARRSDSRPGRSPSGGGAVPSGAGPRCGTPAVATGRAGPGASLRPAAAEQAHAYPHARLASRMNGHDARCVIGQTRPRAGAQRHSRQRYYRAWHGIVFPDRQPYRATSWVTGDSWLSTPRGICIPGGQTCTGGTPAMGRAAASAGVRSSALSAIGTTRVPGPAHALGGAHSRREDTGWVISPHRPLSRVRRPWRRLRSLTRGRLTPRSWPEQEVSLARTGQGCHRARGTR